MVEEGAEREEGSWLTGLDFQLLQHLHWISGDRKSKMKTNGEMEMPKQR